MLHALLWLSAAGLRHSRAPVQISEPASRILFKVWRMSFIKTSAADWSLFSRAILSFDFQNPSFSVAAFFSGRPSRNGTEISLSITRKGKVKSVANSESYIPKGAPDGMISRKLVVEGMLLRLKATL